MLLGEDGGGHEHGDLLAIHDRFEGGAQGDLGLAVADVAADEAIHRIRPLHVVLDLADDPQLVFGLAVGEAGLEFMLPLSVSREGVTGDRFARGIEVEQFAGQLVGRALRGRPGLAPGALAQAVERRVSVFWSNPLAQPVGVVNGDIERVAIGVLHQQVFALHAAQITDHQPFKLADAVIEVDNVIALPDVGEICFRRGRSRDALTARRGPAPAKNLGVGQQVEQHVIIGAADENETLGQATLNKGQAAFRRHLGQGGKGNDSPALGSGIDGRHHRLDRVGLAGLGKRLQRTDQFAAFFAPQLGQPWRLPAEDDDAFSLALRLLELVEERPHLPPIARTRIERLTQFDIARLLGAGFALRLPVAKNERLLPCYFRADLGPVIDRALITGRERRLLLGHLLSVTVDLVGNGAELVPVVNNDQAFRRQVIEQGCRARVDERQIILQVGEDIARQQVGQVVAPRRQAILGRQRLVGPDLGKGARRGRQCLAGGRDDDARGAFVRRGRPLRRWIEVAHRLHLVAKQLDAHG